MRHKKLFRDEVFGGCFRMHNRKYKFAECLLLLSLPDGACTHFPVPNSSAVGALCAFAKHVFARESDKDDKRPTDRLSLSAVRRRFSSEIFSFAVEMSTRKNVFGVSGLRK